MTAMKIIIAEELPSEDVFQYLGYCPQSDVLWKNITVKEHIELYAAIRGVPQKKIKDIVHTYLTALQIQEHANKRSYQCSGGTKRKLSFAIAMVGNPSVVLMDEPSVGMDPHSKRFLWDTILCSFQGSRGAILTTHAMEEADALCSRVGIMVNGKLRCIGSTQHLKNLYGAGYTLEVKINSDDGNGAEKEERIKQFVNDVFPLVTLEETFTDHLLFSIQQSSVKSLAHCFSTIENAKKMLCIEEYSFSQTTLEQVFLKFAHSDIK